MIGKVLLPMVLWWVLAACAGTAAAGRAATKCAPRDRVGAGLRTTIASASCLPQPVVVLAATVGAVRILGELVVWRAQQRRTAAALQRLETWARPASRLEPGSRLPAKPSDRGADAHPGKGARFRSR